MILQTIPPDLVILTMNVYEFSNLLSKKWIACFQEDLEQQTKERSVWICLTPTKIYQIIVLSEERYKEFIENVKSKYEELYKTK